MGDFSEHHSSSCFFIFFHFGGTDLIKNPLLIFHFVEYILVSYLANI